jgi:hypothetical protein
MTEGPKGNTKHKALNPQQTQSTNDQMTKTFRLRYLDLDIVSDLVLL